MTVKSEYLRQTESWEDFLKRCEGVVELHIRSGHQIISTQFLSDGCRTPHEFMVFYMTLDPLSRKDR